MSAVLMVLPRVWATATVAAKITAPDVHRPKAPHRLTLVRAAADVPSSEVHGLFRQPTRNLRDGYQFYRKYTEGLLRRYQTMSFEAGRVPSLMGREMFRGNVTQCKVQGFDDVVIFVHDVSRCLGRLNAGHRLLIRQIAMYGYTQQEAAAMLGLSLRTVVRRYYEALDDLTRMLLESRIMEPLKASGETGHAQAVEKPVKPPAPAKLPQLLH